MYSTTLNDHTTLNRNMLTTLHTEPQSQQVDRALLAGRQQRAEEPELATAVWREDQGQAGELVCTVHCTEAEGGATWQLHTTLHSTTQADVLGSTGHPPSLGLSLSLSLSPLGTTAHTAFTLDCFTVQFSARREAKNCDDLLI